jgi:hypothetical protein
VLVVLADLAHADQLSLRWNDNSLSAVGFLIERRTDPGSFSTVAEVARTDAGPADFVDRAVVPGFVYCYRVRAYNLAGPSAYSNEACAMPSASTGTPGEPPDPGQGPPVLFAAVLPASRSVQIGSPATAFATLVNGGATSAANCGIAPETSLPAAFTFQTTDASSNLPTGTPNSRVTIPPGARQTFALALVPSSPIQSTDVAFAFECDGVTAAVAIGLNTLLVSASSTPGPDIIALVATTSGDGILAIPGPGGTGAFAAATANVGAAAEIAATADTSTVALPLDIALCRIDVDTARCISPLGPTLTTRIDTGETPAFGIFVRALGPVPFDPARHRVFVRFMQNGIARGSTSVAVRTE